MPLPLITNLVDYCLQAAKCKKVGNGALTEVMATNLAIKTSQPSKDTNVWFDNKTVFIKMLQGNVVKGLANLLVIPLFHEKVTDTHKQELWLTIEPFLEDFRTIRHELVSLKDDKQAFLMLTSAYSALQSLNKLGINHLDSHIDNIMVKWEPSQGKYLVKIIDYDWVTYIHDNVLISPLSSQNVRQLPTGVKQHVQTLKEWTDSYYSQGRISPLVDLFIFCSSLKSFLLDTPGTRSLLIHVDNTLASLKEQLQIAKQRTITGGGHSRKRQNGKTRGPFEIARGSSGSSRGL